MVKGLYKLTDYRLGYNQIIKRLKNQGETKLLHESCLSVEILAPEQSSIGTIYFYGYTGINSDIQMS